MEDAVCCNHKVAVSSHVTFKKKKQKKNKEKKDLSTFQNFRQNAVPWHYLAFKVILKGAFQRTQHIYSDNSCKRKF